MSRSPSPESHAILSQLLAELQGYEARIQGLRRGWQAHEDVVLFGEPGKSMDRMRSLAAAVPQLSAQWVMVMISHTELVHDLWRRKKGEPLDVAGEVRDHLAAVDSLAAQCRRLLVHSRRALH